MKWLYFLLLLSFSHCLSAQEREMDELLNISSEACVTVSINAHEQLLKTDWSDENRLHEILDIWEKECGLNEPIVRIRFLLKLKNGSDANSFFEAKYNETYFDGYKRKLYLKENNDLGRYENAKKFYGYIPLHSKLDERTEQLAKEIAKSAKEDEFSKAILLYYQGDLEEYEVFTKKHRLGYEQEGVWKPLYYPCNTRVSPFMYLFHVVPQAGYQQFFGGVSEYLPGAAYYGFSFGIDFHNWKIMIRGRNWQNISPQPFTIYQENDESIMTITSGGEIGGMLHVPLNYDKTGRFMAYGLIGGSSTMYSFKSLPKLNEDDESEMLKGYSINTGLVLNWQTKNCRHFGLIAEYGCHKIANSQKWLRKDVTGHSASLGVVWGLQNRSRNDYWINF